MSEYAIHCGRADRQGKRVVIITVDDREADRDELDTLAAWQREKWRSRVIEKLGLPESEHEGLESELIRKSDLADAEAQALAAGKPRVTCMADVQGENIAWLWPERFALGKLSIISGDPGLGKGFLTLDMVARVTNGATWPDDERFAAPRGSAVIITCEDGMGDTVKPRLVATGADCRRVFHLDGIEDRDGERSFDLSRDLPVLAQVVAEASDCRLVVIDPISAFLGAVDSHKNADVRRVLAPLGELAAEHRVAVIGVNHLRKGAGPAAYRTMGSLAFTAAARAVFAVAKDSSDPDRRLFLPIKNNIGNDRDGLAYRITDCGIGGKPAVEWERGPVATTADDALSQERPARGRPSEDRDDAADWLRGALSQGPRLANDVIEEAREAEGIAKRTLDRARKELHVVAYREKVPGPWSWKLPDEPSQGCHNPKDSNYGNLGNLAKTSGNNAIFVLRNGQKSQGCHNSVDEW